MRKSAFAWLMLLVSACSGGLHEAGTARSVPIGDGAVVVIFSDAPEVLPFNPRAARLVAATQQLTALAGHPIEIGFDAALLPQFRSGFEGTLIGAIENVARDLDALREQHPGAFTTFAPKLRRIDCRYDAVARRPEGKLDVETGVLRITSPADAQVLIGRGLVGAAIDDGYGAHLDKLFAGMEPERVPVGQQSLYFEHLTRYPRGGPPSADLSTPEGLGADPRAIQIDRVARLALLVPPQNTELTLAARAFLIREGGYFVHAYLHHPANVQAAPASTAFHRAEAAWVRWLNTSFDALPDADRAALLRTPLFVRPFNRDLRPGVGRYVAFAFPGFDPFALGLKVIDAWALRGHPMGATGEPPDRQEMFDFIACPYVRDEHGNRSVVPRCEQDFYRFAIDDETRRRRLVGELLARHDVPLTEMTFVNLIRLGREAVDDMLVVWRGLEADASLWSVATQVIVEEFAEVGNKGMLHDEAFRLWRAAPDKRGAVLNLLAAVDRHQSGAVNWKEFEQVFGRRVSEAELVSYLDQGYRAISNAHVLWEALDRGFSRADALLQRLDKYIDEPLVRAYNPRDPERALLEIVKALCAEQKDGDISRLHDYFTKRVAERPSEQRRFATIIEFSTKGRCLAKKGAAPSLPTFTGVGKPTPGIIKLPVPRRPNGERLGF